MHSRYLIVFVFVLFYSHDSFGKEYTRRSVFLATGIGSVETSRFGPGVGLIHGLGYQTDVFKGRLRLVPQIAWGGIRVNADDAPDAYFYSRSAKLDINFDFFRIDIFSIFIGTGITANLSSGLVGGYGFHSSFNFGYNGMVGCRFYTQDRRVAYELKVIEAAIEGFEKDFFEFALFKFQLIYNLRKADSK